MDPTEKTWQWKESRLLPNYKFLKTAYKQAIFLTKCYIHISVACIIWYYIYNLKSNSPITFKIQWLELVLGGYYKVKLHNMATTVWRAPKTRTVEENDKIFGFNRDRTNRDLLQKVEDIVTIAVQFKPCCLITQIRQVWELLLLSVCL